MRSPVRIGCYSAFWGDSVQAAVQLVKHEGKNLDYLVADYLAEITMGILAARRQRRLMTNKPQRGVDYIAEFLTLALSKILPDIARNGTKVITNAGGLDPVSCKEAIEAMLDKMNIKGVKVAAVWGDDVLNGKEERNLGAFEGTHSFSTISTTNHELDADRLPDKDEPIVSLNAYLGVAGIAAALSEGAQIVVTGRVVDSALVVAPLIHEYGWKEGSTQNYHDLLASASLAGHIIECGCHATGGNFTDWHLAAQSPYGGYANMGYPIVEFSQDGSFVVTKPEKTGGLVTPATVSEQMLYEILDPALYLLPDVILDMRQVSLSQAGPNRVLVKGAKGLKPTPYLKCSGIFLDGFKISIELLVGGVDAKKKALAVGEAVIRRVQEIYKRASIPDFTSYNIETIGAESLFGPHSRANESREVMLRLTAQHSDPKALGLIPLEAIPSATCMAPGITGSGTGRPRPVPNLVHFPLLIPKTQVKTYYTVGSGPQKQSTWGAWDPNASYSKPSPVPAISEADISQPLVKTTLINVAYGRSGDKGDVCNVGIIARDPKFLPYIKRSITEKAVSDYMKHLCKGSHQLTFLTRQSQFEEALLSEWLKKEKLYRNLVVVDVRERKEIERYGKIPGALNIPLSPSLFRSALSDLNKEANIVFHCRSGRRSDDAAIIAESLGYKKCFSLEGGMDEWKGPVNPFMNNHSPWVHTVFEKETETAQYVVTDLVTKEAHIIDPVLDYNPFSVKVHTSSADELLRFVEKHELNITKIIETHVHADHLSSASYLKQALKSDPDVYIGNQVTQVQKVFGEVYNLTHEELNPTGEQFDVLTHENMHWTLGQEINCSVISTPGHTPACMSYLIGDAAFVGDTLFMPDVGTARCDFPGGSVESLYESIHKMYNQWPNDTRIYVGHDYPTKDRSYEWMTLLQDHKETNKMINEKVTLEGFTKMRQERDSKLRAPRYIHPSIQTNLRGGVLPTPEVSVHDKKTFHQYFKIPIRWNK
ncbi:hypothetical protein BY458DRAFT_540380 [Sporodiniella umbellata]|nr:hypothetical protein BY458DRAFT_540380 [Sporodiniella umbellata]